MEILIFKLVCNKREFSGINAGGENELRKVSVSSKCSGACRRAFRPGYKPWSDTFVTEDFKTQVIELFRLPMEEKRKLWQQEDSFEGKTWKHSSKEMRSLAMIILCQLAKTLRIDEKEMRELFSDVSNGVYRSIEHRAVVNSNKERLSVATFYTFNLESELGPAHSLIGPNNPAKFRRVPMQKYLQDFFARKLDGKSYVDFMKGINQHEIERGRNKELLKSRCAQWDQGIAPNWQVRAKVLSVARQLGEDLTSYSKIVP
ncbi:hypothetical protein HAX54_037878 [Datura stramonium]|uniref:Uncharacterized protein n=1 Tax=Datura stramonium TaxID=4076 RepID=A0ABS8VM15_DATST|nr:hypothetical protein [Datura stramonium]